ncbi:hypothetical protein [Snodgrassella gandavensis]|uniref:hypothetical protein n=1 Tax=Snodgrassella gandavensis TaxID=2946698 RepID=UPI001EF5160C|nr:hypothetical protein [Snodgrassella gandavensis]
MSEPSPATIPKLVKLTSLLLATTALSSCSGGFEPFVGVTSGKNKSYAAPVEALEYNYENMAGGSINGGCIPGTNGVDDYEVGKKTLWRRFHLWRRLSAGQMETGHDCADLLAGVTLSGLACQRLKCSRYGQRS